jgi:hypothetical protein
MVDFELPSRGVQTVLAGIPRAEARDLPHTRVPRVIPVLCLDLCEQSAQAWVVYHAAYGVRRAIS